MIDSFRDIIAIWQTAAQMAKDVGSTAESVQKWKERNNIPPAYWARTIRAAGKRGTLIKAFDLARMAEKSQ
jgi:hypothetical protein